MKKIAWDKEFRYLDNDDSLVLVVIVLWRWRDQDAWGVTMEAHNYDGSIDRTHLSNTRDVTRAINDSWMLRPLSGVQRRTIRSAAKYALDLGKSKWKKSEFIGAESD